jgi:hypothetical protein
VGGDDPTLKEDGDPTLKEDDSSLLDASSAHQKSRPDSRTNQQQEQELTKIPAEAFFPPPAKSPNKNAMGTGDHPRKSVGSSAQQQKVLAEFTEDELLAFLAFLRRENSKTKATNGTTTNKSTNKSTNESTN